MGFRLILLAATLLSLSTGAGAAIISTDWQATGDNLITQDTATGLEWLDLSATVNRSYNNVSTQFGSGQEFDGWRYATTAEISGFFDAFGGDSNYYAGWSTQNNGLFDAIAPYWGDLLCDIDGCTPGEGNSFFITAESPTPGIHLFGQLYDVATNSLTSTQDFVLIEQSIHSDGAIHSLYGSALVRSTVIPIPAAVWLFGSGLIGLIGVARRKKA